MNFAYNGNLLENDRINLVAQEIVTKYPKIDFEKAKEAAMLEGKISTSKTFNTELNRLYNVMLVNSGDKDIVLLIFKDFLNVLNSSKFEVDNDYMKIADRINLYLQGISEFPFLGDYQ